nr:hypothetical protein GCM10020093_040060 [Planobispora longispora]
MIEIGSLSLRAHRWWDPAPPLGPADPVRLAQALPVMTELCDRSPKRPGLEGNGAAGLLTEGCAEASLLRGIMAAEQLVGLGPGLTPSGDDMLAGLLVALRHLGTATGTGRAVWLADWLAAAVTFDARGRTTPISATLLHCAARGEASGEVLAVLRGLAGRQSLEPALHRLLQLGHTSGADLAWGLRIGLSSVLDLRDGGGEPGAGAVGGRDGRAAEHDVAAVTGVTGEHDDVMAATGVTGEEVPWMSFRSGPGRTTTR